MIERLIMDKLRKGPVYARSFHAAKPVVQALIKRGLIRRVAPPGGRGKNMLEIVNGSD